MDLLFPAGWALGALSVPLVALYFLRLRRRRVVVPSLLPWHALRQSERLSSPFHRLRRHLLLLVQLLALALMVAAFVRPALEGGSGEARSVVVVVDTTASMGAVDVAPSRFEQARARARRALDDLSPGDEAMLVAAGSATEVVVPFTRDRAALLAGVGRLAPTEAEGGLAEALGLVAGLARTRPAVEVVVLSDGGSRELSEVRLPGARVRFEPVGSSAENAGIVALELRRPPAAGQGRQLFVTARHFGATATDGSVEVLAGGRLVALRNLELPPEEPVSLVFDLEAALAGEVEVRLSARGDQLPADDRAFAVLAPLAATEVLLVGADPLVARILAADPRLRATVVAPEQATPERLAAADAVLVAGPVPDGLDGLDVAVLGPWPGSPVRFGEAVAAPRILGSQRTHPALRHARLDGVFIAESRRVEDGGGLATVLEGEGGPLILAGTRQGGRVLQLAFDPLASDLPMRVAWPLLVLDTVSWLAGDEAGGGEGSVIRTGEPVVRRLPEGQVRAVVRGPGGRDTVEAPDGVLRLPAPDRVGVYELSAGAWRDTFAANLLAEGESRIRPRSTLGLGAVPGAEAGPSQAAVGRRELWRPLLLAALAALVAEWLLWNRRRVA